MLTWNRYLEVADPWPLNPQGEILLGLKVEDRHALINAEASVQVPGVGFAEWGPSDMGFSLRSTKLPGEELSTLMRKARQRVFSACKAAGVAFLNGVRPDTVEAMIDEGVMIRVRGPRCRREGPQVHQAEDAVVSQDPEQLDLDAKNVRRLAGRPRSFLPQLLGRNVRWR